MNMQRKCKTKTVQEDLIKKITAGLLIPGSDFPTLEELIQQYKISIGTACKITHELNRLGLIEVVQGRKSRIVIPTTAPAPPKLLRPVGIVNPPNNPPRLSRWRERNFQYFQQQILLHGNQFLWVPDDFEANGIIGRYAGIIFTGEFVLKQQWDQLMAQGIPCVKVTFEQPLYNEVFVDYRQALDHLVLHLIKTGCRRVLFLAPTHQEHQNAVDWHLRHTRFMENLHDYGITDERRSFITIMSPGNTSFEDLKKEISQSSEKIAFIPHCSIYNSYIIEIMAALGLKLYQDYEIYCLAKSENPSSVGHAIDQKRITMATRMLDMLYRQSITGQKQLGEVMSAEFVPAV